MEQSTMRETMTGIFREVFADPSIRLSDDTTAKDIQGWDSLKHVTLIVAMEKAFGVSFSSREILSLKRHRELEDLVASKIAARPGPAG